MAGEAPICNGNLFKEFGYTANTMAGQAVLDGTYVAPDETDHATMVIKETSLSESGLHFGHYVVGSASEIISYYHAAWVTTVIAHAIQLERWSRGLSVMLEKTLGVTLVTKLRAILLMEADFNA